MTLSIGIQGVQEAQRDNLRMVSRLRPSSGIGQAVRVATAHLHRYAVVNTHVDTGALRASHRMEFSFGTSNAQGVISIDGGSRNPRSKAKPSVYGPAEHNRGGEHAFYERTFETQAHRAGSLALDTLTRILG